MLLLVVSGCCSPDTADGSQPLSPVRLPRVGSSREQGLRCPLLTGHFAHCLRHTWQVTKMLEKDQTLEGGLAEKSESSFGTSLPNSRVLCPQAPGEHRAALILGAGVRTTCPFTVLALVSSLDRYVRSTHASVLHSGE